MFQQMLKFNKNFNVNNWFILKIFNYIKTFNYLKILIKILKMWVYPKILNSDYI